MRRCYQEHDPGLRKYVSRRMCCRTDTEDVCQEIWLSFFTRYDEFVATYDDVGKVLYPIATCRIADFWRRRGRTREAPVEDLVLLVDSLHPGAETDADRGADIRRALEKLTVRQREALHLRYADDLKVDTVAVLMGITAHAVKKLVTKALKTLRGMGFLDSYRPEEGE